jgi:hypothetical protein
MEPPELYAGTVKREFWANDRVEAVNISEPTCPQRSDADSVCTAI